MNDPQPLDEVRRELQRLGYLSHRFDRFLLQDALAPAGGAGGLAALAAKVGASAGALLAAANALALAAANRILGSAPVDVLLLFVHLLVPVALAVAAGFLVTLGLLRAVLAAFPRRGLGMARVALALAGSAGLLAAGVWVGWEPLRRLPPLERVLVAAALPLVVAAVARLLADGLLAFGVRWTHRAPRGRLGRREVALALAASVVVVGAAALAVAPPAAEPPPTSLPVAAGDPVLMVGLDGVLADELDFLLARGDLPNLARLARQGGVLGSYRRAAQATPAELWTTFATGRLAADHGVVALDGYRPRGLSSTLSRTGPWRAYFAHVATPLGLAEQRPLLSNRRRAPTFWELVARGGRPVAAIDWWGTFPAESLPGLVVAHGAYDLLAEEAPAAVAPESRREEVARLRIAARAAAARELAELGLAAPSLVDRALAPDALSRAIARRTAEGSRAMALYLPAADVAADGWAGSAEQLAELVRRELVDADALLGELAGHFGTVAVAFDPGRRGGEEGRLLLWNGSCEALSRPRLDLRAAAAALLRAAGLPQSRELPEPPPACRWPAPPAEIATYGERPAGGAPEASGDEYLEALRSLGYL